MSSVTSHTRKEHYLTFAGRAAMVQKLPGTILSVDTVILSVDTVVLASNEQTWESIRAARLACHSVGVGHVSNEMSSLSR